MNKQINKMKKKRTTFIIVTMIAYLLTLGGAISANAQQLGDPIEFSVGWGDDTIGFLGSSGQLEPIGLLLSAFVLYVALRALNIKK